MKKPIALLLLIAMLCTVFVFAGCNNWNNPDDNDDNTDTNNLVALGELPQYMANINGATAFGVLQKNTLNAQSNKTRAQNVDKNYFVMTTEE